MLVIEPEIADQEDQQEAVESQLRTTSFCMAWASPVQIWREMILRIPFVLRPYIFARKVLTLYMCRHRVDLIYKV